MANEDLTHDTDIDRDYDFEDQEFFEPEGNDEENDLSCLLYTSDAADE